jgi:imidazolonepropionase-like amidohydrolase
MGRRGLGCSRVGRATTIAVLLLGVVVAPLRGAIGQGNVRPTVFWDVALVDLDECRAQPSHFVEVMEGRITRVGEAVGRPPDGTTIVEGRGGFLMPGLWDSHVHLTKLGRGALAAFVANGVTSVRDMGSDLAEVSQWRAQIESGTMTGPRIKTAGQILESAANVARMKREQTVEPVDRIRIGIGTPQEAIEAVDRLARGGADFIKVRTVADRETLDAIAAAAREHDLKITGHPLVPPDALAALGFASVEHLLATTPLAGTEDTRAALFASLRNAGVSIGSSIVNFDESILIPYERAIEKLRTDASMRYVSDYLEADWREQVQEKSSPEAAEILQQTAELVPRWLSDLRALHQAGVPFLAGTDAAVAFIYPGVSLHGELEALVRRLGFSPCDALRSATLNPAKFFGLDRELGRVRENDGADLVLLEENPLEAIHATRAIGGVMRAGRWYDRNGLANLLERAAADAQQ